MDGMHTIHAPFQKNIKTVIPFFSKIVTAAHISKRNGLTLVNSNCHQADMTLYGKDYVREENSFFFDISQSININYHRETLRRRARFTKQNLT